MTRPRSQGWIPTDPTFDNYHRVNESVQVTREPIAIPSALQRRILTKNEAFVRAKRELEELLELTQELLEVPPGYVLQDVTKGFVPVETTPQPQQPGGTEPVNLDTRAD